MENVLGRKQSIKNEDWLAAVSRIEELVPRVELDKLVEDTVKEIRLQAAGKKAAYAWSGGKDSLVLGEICRRADITECMIGICNLEYPEFLTWIQEHKPENLEILNTGQDMAWLEKHKDMLFPADSKAASRWFSIVQHRAQAKYYKAHDLDLILLGRRRADGNYCGKGGNIYTDSKGVTRYSPLAGWKHEAVLAYIHYYNVPMPPIYGWPNGYLCGTHPWPARQWTGSEESGWAEVYQIDPGIVAEAARKFPGAKKFLKSMKKK
ncbi:phosphoadenosine phosphosulfate reductase family protein [Enterocloster clostridioformis]